MKKKTTWAASVVKKQLQTCCKHEGTFSLETTERDEQEIHISSPIKEEARTSVLLRRRSFTRGLLISTTPEPLTPFRKSVESAMPLCRSSTGRLQEEMVVAPPKGKTVLHKSGPLPVLQQLFRLPGASPLNVKKQLSGPLMSKPTMSAAPSPKQPTPAGPSPQRLSKVKFSPILHEATAMIAEEEQTPKTQHECHPVASSSEAKSEAIASEGVNDEVARCGERQDHVVAAAVRIQAAFRGYQVRKRNSTASVSTEMSRTGPEKQRRTPPPRAAARGWNGSMRSAQDHQALLRSRQEATLKRERAMDYALSRQRWRSRRAGPDLDDRAPDKPGWVRSWLERAARMSNAQTSHLNVEPPQSESLSVKSTVGMCTTDIGSAEVNLGWPLSLRQQHAAGLLQPKTPIETQREFSTSTSTSDLSSTSELIESSGRHHGHDLESVGSCDGPALPSPVVVIVAKPRKLSNSNSVKRDRVLVFAQSQVSVALSDGDSADTTAASVQRPLWR